MKTSTHSPVRRLAVALVGVVSIASMSACSALGTTTASDATPVAATTTPATPAFESAFTTEGSFQSHVISNGIDFVYTVWPSKRTPNASEWHPTGPKYFNVTVQAYDTDRDFRSSFASKRMVYLDTIRISTQTVTASGNTESPYTVSAPARTITFDPEPQTTKRGMLITSPKGAFELRNAVMGTVASDTRGINMIIEGQISIQRSAGSKSFHSELMSVTVPIGITASSKATPAKDVPDTAL